MRTGPLPDATTRLPEWAVPLLMLAAALLFRALSFVPAVVDTDEGLYILQAREWLRGGWPLDAVWDMHPIGAPAVFAIGMAGFGSGIAAVRLLGAVFVALTAWALYGLARTGGVARAPSLGAGVLYAALTTQFGGMATNTELLFAPFVVAALTIGLRGAVTALDWDEAPRWSSLFWMGLLVGIALTIKPVATPEGCLAFALLVLVPLWRGVLGFARGLAMAVVYAGLCALPTLLFALAYAIKGDLAEFLDGSFEAPMRYAGGRHGFSDAAWAVGIAALTVLWPIVLGVVALVGRRTPEGMVPVSSPGRRMGVLGLAWLAAASLAIAGPGMFYIHYFLIWLPPLSLLAALGAWALVDRLWPARAALGFSVIIGVVAVDAWRVDTIPRLRQGIGLHAPDPVREVARAVAAVIAPGEPVLMANYHSVVIALSGAGLATRYAFPPHFTGLYGGVTGIDIDAEVARVLAERPAAIVVDRGWWHSIRPEVQAMLTTALAEGYVLAASVPEERGMVEVWRRR
ncbi:ArnT family glycosyltransferase [Humitalea sp. 24SJ18S-53]|uniref:ArnT family glycosyltransferase n=1 Tax=Humitalea sp. 24SJ18S-53 TaxID=3422307 RepID=UPI003D66B1FE